MARATLNRSHRKVCVGDLNKLITLSAREITEPAFGSTDFGEDFPDARDVWAKIRTITGRTLFNGVDTDIPLTHEITIRFDPNATSESWVLLKKNGTRIKIVDIQNLEEQDEYLVMLCTARGTEEASKL